jgi:hypothetical protein
MKKKQFRRTRVYHCCCGCDGKIKPGEKLIIKKGSFFIPGHEKNGDQAFRNNLYAVNSITIPKGFEIRYMDHQVIGREIKKHENAEQLTLL